MNTGFKVGDYVGIVGGYKEIGKRGNIFMIVENKEGRLVHHVNVDGVGGYAVLPEWIELIDQAEPPKITSSYPFRTITDLKEYLGENEGLLKQLGWAKIN